MLIRSRSSPNSSLITVAPVRIAKSSVAFFLVGPKPGRSIILTLIFLTIEGFKIDQLIPTLDLIKDYKIIYILTMFTAIFTAYTGIIYLYTNRIVIKDFINNS